VRLFVFGHVGPFRQFCALTKRAASKSLTLLRRPSLQNRVGAMGKVGSQRPESHWKQHIVMRLAYRITGLVPPGLFRQS
jgi:hypothetical protein